MRVLIVEDHKAQAAALMRLLQKKIPLVKLRVAHTLADGLAQAREFNADITLLDIQLPDADQKTVLLSIKQFTPPVIVITALDPNDGALMLECFAHGAENFFSKESLASLVSSITAAHLRNVMPAKLDPPNVAG